MWPEKDLKIRGERGWEEEEEEEEEQEKGEFSQ
jgi:hypothetical protein